MVMEKIHLKKTRYLKNIIEMLKKLDLVSEYIITLGQPIMKKEKKKQNSCIIIA